MSKYLRAVLVAAAVAGATAAGTTAAQAVDTSCTAQSACFWTMPGFRGDKYEVALNGRECHNVFPTQVFSTQPDRVFVVRSLKVGARTSVSSMRPERNCQGSPSASYRPGAQVARTNFPMKSVR